MEYRPLAKLVAGSEQAQELVFAINEVNSIFATHERLLPANARGLAYAQAIVDEVFERVLPHRAYKVTVVLYKQRVQLEIQEPVLMLQHEKP